MSPFNSMVGYCRRVLMLGFLLSSITWAPQVYHSFTLFFSVSLPNIISVMVAPKCLFVVSNLIVIFLFGESKLEKCTKKNKHESMNTSEKAEYAGVENKMFFYEKLGETNVRIIQENKKEEAETAVEEKKIVQVVAEREEAEAPKNGEEGAIVPGEMETRWNEDDKIINEHDEMENKHEEMVIREDENDIESEHEELEREDDEEIKRQEEEIERWTAEELNRKVEDFIAKFNMQIRLEARIEATTAISCY